jgi:hypothetical protein
MLAQERNLAQLLCRGVCRALSDLGFAPLTEFTLACGRRADIFALSDRGEALIVEIKSSIEDFRSDQKWPDYQPWCDRFYFAVGEAFPRELVPEECGLMVADAFSAVVLREAPIRALAPQRRKALTLRAALAASERLQRLTDPGF